MDFRHISQRSQRGRTLLLLSTEIYTKMRNWIEPELYFVYFSSCFTVTSCQYDGNGLYSPELNFQGGICAKPSDLKLHPHLRA